MLSSGIKEFPLSQLHRDLFWPSKAGLCVLDCRLPVWSEPSRQPPGEGDPVHCDGAPVGDTPDRAPPRAAATARVSQGELQFSFQGEWKASKKDLRWWNSFPWSFVVVGLKKAQSEAKPV